MQGGEEFVAIFFTLPLRVSDFHHPGELMIQVLLHHQWEVF